MNETITKYIAEERTRGVADDAIRTALLAKGWRAEDVNAGFGGGQAAVTMSAAGPREFSFMGMFEGRLMRWQYFVTSLIFGLLFFVFGAGIGLLLSTLSIEGPMVMMLNIVVFTSCIAFSLSLSVRRLHDMDWNGWLVLLLFIPLVNLIIALLMLFMKGSDGSNKYGPPQGDRPFIRTLLNT